MFDEDRTEEMMDKDLRDKCCAKCRYFEERTNFCRFNPPIPIVICDKNGVPFITSVYSKINMPAIDWCQKFDKLV